MHAIRHQAAVPGLGRRTISTSLAIVGTIVWAHAFAGLLRAAAGIAAPDFAPASFALTIAAVLTAIAGGLGVGSFRRSVGMAGLTAVGSAVAIGLLHHPALIPALALVPAGLLSSTMGVVVVRRLPSNLDSMPSRHARLTTVWVLLTVVAVVQIGRLSTYMSNPDSDWFLSTRHPFYAKHECASAYVYGAELTERRESNVYDAVHYPGLNPEATPHTSMAGMSPEDPFQYAPQFLLWPRLAIEATRDYDSLRTLWFAANVTLCFAAVLMLGVWIGGSAGLAAGLLSPLVLASFPVLHNFQYGQFHFAAIALTVLSLLAFQRERFKTRRRTTRRLDTVQTVSRRGPRCACDAETVARSRLDDGSRRAHHRRRACSARPCTIHSVCRLPSAATRRWQRFRVRRSMARNRRTRHRGKPGRPRNRRQTRRAWSIGGDGQRRARPSIPCSSSHCSW